MSADPPADAPLSVEQERTAVLEWMYSAPMDGESAPEELSQPPASTRASLSEKILSLSRA